MVTWATNECRFLMSTESELLTVFGSGDPASHGRTISLLLTELGRLAPSAAGRFGLFNCYGRVYLDGSHLELAAAECDSPFSLIKVMQSQQQLLAMAADRLRSRGIELTIANCNHSGCLSDTTSTWGSHENYLVQERPEGWADRILPFLVTRLYTGSGGVHFPTGNFLAGVRLHFLNRDRGGGTLSDRAIHSTARSEHLTSNPDRYGYRYHILLGDGVQSEFSQLLRIGTTAVVLKMLEWEAASGNCQNHLTNRTVSDAYRSVPTDGSRGRQSFWMRALRQFNLLAKNGSVPAVHPLVCRVQRSFLRRCDLFHAACPDLPVWVGELLAIWDCTLSALERCDLDWLAQRLDPWIKYRLMSRLLSELKAGWRALRDNEELHQRLALLNQDYHDLCKSESIFRQCSGKGLQQQVVPTVIPGTEADPFVPEIHTRAAARARFLKAYAKEKSSSFFQRVEMDWSTVTEIDTRRVWRLDDPFSMEYQEMQPSH